MATNNTTFSAVTSKNNLTGNGNVTTDDTDDPTDAYDPATLRLLGTIFICIGVVAFVLNLLAILAILTNSRMRTINANIFIVNMALVDLIYCCGAIVPIGVWNYQWEFFGTFLHCQIQIYFESAMTYVSNWSVALVALDKYLFIAKPFMYESWMPRRNVIIIIVLSWLLPMIFGAISLWAAKNTWYEEECFLEPTPLVPQIHAFIYFLVPLVFIIVFGSLIVAIVWDHQRRIAALDIGRNTSGRQQVSWKAVNTVLLVVLSFLFLQAPYHLTTTVNGFCGCIQYQIISEYLFYPLYVSSLVNPLVYVFTDRKLRRSLILMITCGRYKGTIAEASTSDSANTNRTRTTNGNLNGISVIKDTISNGKA